MRSDGAAAAGKAACRRRGAVAVAVAIAAALLCCVGFGRGGDRRIKESLRFHSESQHVVDGTDALVSARSARVTGRRFQRTSDGGWGRGQGCVSRCCDIIAAAGRIRIHRRQRVPQRVFDRLGASGTDEVCICPLRVPVGGAEGGRRRLELVSVVAAQQDEVLGGGGRGGGKAAGLGARRAAQVAKECVARGENLPAHLACQGRRHRTMRMTDGKELTTTRVCVGGSADAVRSSDLQSLIEPCEVQ